jgi:hypothetical protein
MNRLLDISGSRWLRGKGQRRQFFSSARDRLLDVLLGAKFSQHFGEVQREYDRTVPSMTLR